MLTLRKILLCDKLYYTILIFAICYVLLYSLIPGDSFYKISKEFIGVVTDKRIKNNKKILTVKNNKKILATTYKKINIDLGDKVKIIGKLEKASTNSTKYLFNYRKYLERQNIYYVMEIEKIEKIKSNNSFYYSILKKLRKKLKNNAYLHTFLLGDKSYISKKVINSYQENGISHLFALSGMHITLLVNLIFKVLKKIKIDEKKIFLITTIILLLYLLFLSPTPSILRAILFYIFFSLNKIYYFYIKPENTFILVLATILFLIPNSIYDVGFYYSFSISYSLIMLSYLLNNKNYFISLLKVSIISFIVSIPISLYAYYEINLLSIIYNLFFVPLVSLIIFPMSLLIFVCPFLNDSYMILISFLEKSSLCCSKITFLKFRFKRLNIIYYVLYVLIIYFFIKMKNKKILLYLFFCLCIHSLITKFNYNNFIQILDVGQGDSIFLNINNKSVLIDTGGSFDSLIDNKVYNYTLNPFFKTQGISKISYLVLTHGDADHCGEAINLVNNFKVEKVIFNCGEFNDLEKELIKVLNKKKIPYYSCIKELNIDKNKLYFLQTKEYDNENDNSNVIYTELNGYKFMFMGDASVTTEKEILDKYNLSDIDVLKVGHHGSRTSSSKEFINEINPKYSIISVGKNNRYGHPNKEVLNNLDDSRIYRTDQDGSIMFKIKNNKLKIETCSP